MIHWCFRVDSQTIRDCPVGSLCGSESPGVDFTNATGVESECWAGRVRTSCLGCKRSRVQIPAARPTIPFCLHHVYPSDVDSCKHMQTSGELHADFYLRAWVETWRAMSGRFPNRRRRGEGLRVQHSLQHDRGGDSRQVQPIRQSRKARINSRCCQRFQRVFLRSHAGRRGARCYCCAAQHVMGLQEDYRQAG